MTEIKINDGELSSAVREWLALDGLIESDCTVSDENNASFSDPLRPLIVLYSSRDYLKSDVHSDILSLRGNEYSAVPLPLSFDALSSAVRTVLFSPAASVEHSTTPTAKPCPTFSHTGRSVTYLGKSVILSAREFDLFMYLYERANTVVSRDELRTNVWGDGQNPVTNTVDVYISYLRRKTEPLLGKGAIVSVRRDGYMLII